MSELGLEPMPVLEPGLVPVPDGLVLESMPVLDEPVAELESVGLVLGLVLGLALGETVEPELSVVPGRVVVSGEVVGSDPEVCAMLMPATVTREASAPRIKLLCGCFISDSFQ